MDNHHSHTSHGIKERMENKTSFNISKTTFLNGDLDAEVFMEIPQGVEVANIIKKGSKAIEGICMV